MVATWPGTLPTEFMREGFSSRQEDNRINFQPQAGPPKRRLRTTGRSYIISASMNLTSTQCAVLKAFFEDDLADGTLPFEFPNDPSAFDSDADEAVHMTFESIITYNPTGGFHNGLPCYRASFELRRMPP